MSAAEELVLNVQDKTTEVPSSYTLRAMSDWTLRDVFDKLSVGRSDSSSSSSEFEVRIHLGRDVWATLEHKWRDMTLEELGFEERTQLLVRRRGSDAEADAAASATADDGADAAACSCAPPPPPPPPGAGSRGAAAAAAAWDADDWDRRSKTGYCGLSNQGATCYMNSLLQSLFMTPEFRRAVYAWSFEDHFARMLARRQHDQQQQQQQTEGSKEEQKPPPQQTEEEFREAREEASIPLQLQRLFARMQLGTRRAEETKKLTRSFGWTGAEAFQQHDAQELCRVLFDSLEAAFAGTEQAPVINDLFQGKMTDYVLCTECGKLSARQDVYLDVPLVIKPFGETKAVPSVNEALRRFVRPELLEGANAYACERCGKRVTAKKGLSFLSFPYILTLQLKRFDFDYQTMRRIKLNDRVEFPFVLDLNELLEGDAALKDKLRSSSEHVAVARAAASAAAEPTATTDADATMAAPAESPTLEPTPERPFIYELYAVLIHRGSAFGGHYFAYIKDFASKKWFEFNDSSVTEISEADVKGSFGEDETKSGGSWYGANAYMLMYRRVEPSRNVLFPAPEEVPESLRELVAGDAKRAAEKAERRRIERETYVMRCFNGANEKDLSLHKSTPTKTALQKALELFELGDVALENARLRIYVPSTDSLQEPLPCDDSPLSKHGLSSYRSLALETRAPGAEFEAWDPNKFVLRVIAWDQATTSFKTMSVPATKNDTVADIRASIAAKLGVAPEHLRILQERGAWDSTMWNNLIDGEKNFFSVWGTYDGLKLWVEESPSALDPAATLLGVSQCAMEMSRLRSMVTIKLMISHPGPETREVMFPTDKRLALKTFKQQIAETAGLDPSEMRVSSGSQNWKYELKNVEHTLEDHHIRDGMELFIDKGRPMLEGEYRVLMHLYAPSDAAAQKDSFVYTKLKEIVLNETIPVPDAKRAVCEQLADCQELSGVTLVPERIRLREMYASAQLPGPPFLNSGKVKDCSFLYNGKSLALQLLDGPEPYTSRDMLLINVQRWHPSTLALGKRVEVVFPETITVNEFRAWVAQNGDELLASNIDIARSRRGYLSGLSILEAATELEWASIPADDATTKMFDQPLLIRTGDLVVVKDRTEPVKELSLQERQELEKAATAARGVRYSGYHHESALKIRKTDDF